MHIYALPKSSSVIFYNAILQPQRKLNLCIMELTSKYNFHWCNFPAFAVKRVIGDLSKRATPVVTIYSCYYLVLVNECKDFLLLDAC